MLASEMSITSVLGSAYVTYGLVTVVLLVVASSAAVFLRRRRGDAPVRQICQRLDRISGDVASDLRQLQLEDTCGRLGESWNHLIREIESARQEIEAAHTRQQARETLDRYEVKWFTQVLNQLPFGMVVVSDDWIITFANAAASRMLGMLDGNLKGQKLTDFVRQDLSHITPGHGAAIDQTCELKSGAVLIRVSAMDSVAATSSGETALLLQDITLEREREQERSQFLYHVTHELRTPLTNIRAYAETLSEGVLKDPDTLRECYNVIVGETQRLNRLVEDILSLSQMEAGATRLNMDDVVMARLIRQVVEDMQAQADEKQLELVLSMPAKMPTLRGDKERLAVVLTNLVGNAIKYTPAGGKVEINCAEEAARLHIKVVDTGIGINPADAERAFEKFYRSSDERVAALPGTGLGLALALETARMHGGTITLESELGKGSTFTLVLPVGTLAAVQT